MFDKDNYDIVYDDNHYTTDYRSKDEKLTKLKAMVRNIIKSNTKLSTYDLELALYNNLMKVCSNKN